MPNVNTTPVSDVVNQSVNGARGFYFVMYTAFYIAVCYYPNQLRDAVVAAAGGDLYSLTYVVFYIGNQVVAVFYFLTAGRNPGFVDETETAESKREKAAHLGKLSVIGGAPVEEDEESGPSVNLGHLTSMLQKRYSA